MRVAVERCVAAITLVALGTSWASGHPISLTTAISEIDNQTLHVKLRVMPEDVVTVLMVEADADDLYAPTVLSEQARLYREVVLEDFAITDEHGEKMAGQVVAIDGSALPETGVHRKALMEFSIVYQIEYDLREKPESLTFTQNFTERPGIIQSFTDLIILRDGKLLGQPTQVTPDRPYTVSLEWPRWFERLELWICTLSVVLLFACVAAAKAGRAEQQNPARNAN